MASVKILHGPWWEFPGDNKAKGLHGDSLLMTFQSFKTSGIRNHVEWITVTDVLEKLLKKSGTWGQQVYPNRRYIYNILPSVI